MATSTSKELAVSLGLTKSSRVLINRSSSNNRALPTAPHSQTWSLSEGANKKCGTCRVCFATRQLHNNDGTIQPPLPDSIRSANIRSDLQSTDSSPVIGANVAGSSTSTSSALVTQEVSPSTSSNSNVIQHPVRSGPILQRIPKNARVHVGNLALKLINDIIQHPTSITCWSRLLDFPSACLAKPSRGGKSRNLTTKIINQVQQYEAGVVKSPSTHRTTQRCLSSVKTPDQLIAAAAAAKLEDGDVKGAVRILCSDDKLAVVNTTTLNELSGLHPCAPLDRRPAPSIVVPPLQVSPMAIKKAIYSFPNGSAGGPDGLRPQHLKDLLLGAHDDHPLLLAITDLVNLQLEGLTPSSVRSTLFGASLLAISKKTGGVRPIAVGYVWRRLTAKVACCHVKEASATLLAPRQLGFGIAVGAEAVVRTARRYVDNLTPGQVLVKIDFKNAFNTLRRDSILEAVAKYFPELLAFAQSTIGQESVLQFGDFVLQSSEGAQQGDPLGPLYFCLTFKELLESLLSELVLGFLDDVALGGDAASVLKDFILLEAAAKQLGLELNRNKCEIVGLSDDTRALFASHGINLPETSPADVILLGAPLSAGPNLDAVLESKRLELQRLSKRLELMPSHDSLYLLRNVL